MRPTLVVAAFVASMMATTLLMGASVARVWDWLPFTSAGVLRDRCGAPSLTGS